MVTYVIRCLSLMLIRRIWQQCRLIGTLAPFFVLKDDQGLFEEAMQGEQAVPHSLSR